MNNAYPIKTCVYQYQSDTGKGSPDDPIQAYSESGEYYHQQWRIIRLLAENGTLDFQDLANQACILRPSLTGILTRLEKAGLVVRLKPSNDQRRVFLKLTAEGEKLYEEIGEEVDERYDAIEEVLGREKMLLLKDLLAELAKIEDALNS